MHITPKKWRKFAIMHVLVVFVLVFGIGLIFEEIGDTLVIGAMLISARLQAFRMSCAGAARAAAGYFHMSFPAAIIARSAERG